MTAGGRRLGLPSLGALLLAALLGAPSGALAQDAAVSGRDAGVGASPIEASSDPPTGTRADPAPRRPTPPPPPAASEPEATSPASDPSATIADGGAPLFEGDAAPPAPDAGQEIPDAGVDAGPPDAGPPDAGPPPPAPVEDDAWSTVLEELLFDRREAAREAAEARREAAQRATRDRPSEPRVVVNNAPTLADRDVGVRIVGCDAPPSLLGLDVPERRVSTFGLALLLGLALFGIAMIDRARKPLPTQGLVPRLLGAAHLALRLTAVVMVLMMASRLLPVWMRPALLLSIAAVAVAVGFGAAWMLLPDVVGGAVLYTERRLRPGQWVVGDGFEGRVQQIGPRLTLLEDRDGVTVSIPNRQLVKSRLRVSERRWHEVEVTLSIRNNRDADDVRRSIEDAVLSSPHVPSDPHLVLARDPSRPERWTVRARLIEPGFAQSFEGQLLERVEEALRASAWAHPDTDEHELE